MPNYKGHLAGGLCTFVGGMVLVHPWLRPTPLMGLELFAFSLAGSLFPDIDIKSKGQKLFYKGISLLIAVLLIQHHFASCALISLFAYLPLLVNHRGLFHKTWFILVCGILPPLYARLYMLEYSAIICWQSLFFTAGAISHLWLDLGFRKMWEL